MASQSSPSGPSPVSPHREEISRALTAYYTLLTQFPYLQSTAIQHPPPGGWNLSTAEGLRTVGNKSAAAIDLLNHIPYLSPSSFELTHDTLAIDWRSPIVDAALSGDGTFGLPPAVAETILRFQQAGLEPMGQSLPPNVTSLTQAGLYGRWLLLDVATGLVTNYAVLAGPNPVPKVTDEEREEGVMWRKYETRPLTELLEDCTEKLRSLEWIPLPHYRGESGSIRIPHSANDLDQEELHKIYRECGWQREWRKEECRAKLFEWQEKKSSENMKAYNESRGARAAKRRAALAANEIAEGKEPSWDSEGNPVICSGDEV
jgi:hypothetical protein